MTGHDLFKWILAEPFVPFRIRLSNGEVLFVRHPKTLKVGQTSAVFLTFMGGAMDIYDDLQVIGLEIIESVEPLEPAHSQSLSDCG